MKNSNDTIGNYRLISSQLLSIIIAMRYSISPVWPLPLFIASTAH